MQSDSDENVQKEIKLKSATDDYLIPGFSEEYDEYVKGCSGGAIYVGGGLIFIGLITSVVGFLTLIFGPSTITYNVFTGPAWWQYILIYPYLTGLAGCLMCYLGSRLFAKRVFTPDVYLRSTYKFMTHDGRDVSAEVEVRHLEGESFSISIK